MFIRSVKTRSKGITYTVQRLVESYKTAEGKVRQRVIMNLGNLEEDLPKRHWKELATLLELRINGQTYIQSYSEELEKLADSLYAKGMYAKSKASIADRMEKGKSFDTIDINSIQVSEARPLGGEIVAKSIWDELGFEEVLTSCGLSQTELSVAMALIIGRLINPGSELETHRWFQSRTALPEMMPHDITGIGKDIFYTTGDILYSNKDKIEAFLYDRETEIFTLDRKLFLFDLTNTYFEGSAKANELAHYGKSKEKRMDCPLVSMALMVDGAGFPVYSRIYEGNVSEPKTIKEIIEEIKERSDGYLKMPIFIMDRGIATKENINFLDDSGYQYIVIERSNKTVQYENEYRVLKTCLASDNADLSAFGWSTIGDEGKVFLKEAVFEKGKHVIAMSILREQKELAIDEQKAARFRADIEKLQTSIKKGCLKKIEKVNARIGRLTEKYKGAASFYDISVQANKENPALVHCIELTETKKKDQKTVLAGTYVIETNQVNLSKEEIWKLYTALTKVEAAFRDLKSELGMRPIYHTNALRTKAHLFIGMLAYHMLVAIEYRMSIKGDTRLWSTLRNILSTHQRATVTMVNEKKQILQLRISTNPEPQHLEIYRKLNVADSLKRIRNVVSI